MTTPIPPPTETVTDEDTRFTFPWYHYFSQSNANTPKGFFQVNLNSTNQTGVTQGSTTTIISFNNEVADSGLWFDTTLFRYTPQESGYYQFYASAYVSPLTTTYTPEIGIAKNSTVAFWGSQISGVSSAFGATGVVSGLMQMNGTSDYIEFRIKSPSATIQGDPTRTFAYGYKIGST